MKKIKIFVITVSVILIIPGIITITEGDSYINNSKLLCNLERNVICFSNELVVEVKEFKFVKNKFLIKRFKYLNSFIN